jgi:hypothetical protein
VDENYMVFIASASKGFHRVFGKDCLEQWRPPVLASSALEEVSLPEVVTNHASKIRLFITI